MKAAVGVILVICASAVPARAQTFTVLAPDEGSQTELLRPAVVFGFPERSVSGSDRDRIRVTLDGIDVSEFLVWSTDHVRLRSPVPVSNGEHVVELTRHGDDSSERLARVTFQTVPPDRQSTANMKLADSSTLELNDPDRDTMTIAPHADGAIDGPWGRTQYDATWTQPIALDDTPQAALAPNFVVQHERGRLRATAGVTKLESMERSQFLGLRTLRRVVEATYARPGLGSLRAFSNLADAIPGAAGQRVFKQWIQGVAWQPAVGGRRVALTLTAESVRDRDASARTRGSFALPERGSLVGALAAVALPRGWNAAVEMAASRREVSAGAIRQNGNDSAFRFDLTGTLVGNTIEARFSRVGTRFGNPGDPGLKNDRQVGEVVVARRARRWNYRFQASFASDGLDRTRQSADEARYRLTVQASLRSGIRATMNLDRQATDGARVDRVQTKSEWRLDQRRGRIRWDLRLGLTETDDRLRQRNVSVKKLRGSVRYAGTGLLMWSAGGGLESRDDSRRQTNRRNLFLEPVWRLGDPSRRLSFRLAYDFRRTPGRTDTRRLSGRSSLSWTPSSAWHGATLVVDVGWDRLTDRLIDTMRTNRVAALKLVFAPQWITGSR